MSIIDVVGKELRLKIVYYGPGLSGKTTSLKAIHGGLSPERKSKLISLATAEDRTLYFDYLPVELPKLKDYTVRLNLYTVPGQVHYAATRKLVLQGVDGVVFVADSQEPCRERNMESLEDLEGNLRDWKLSLETFPHVFQYNKRDLPGLMPVDQMDSDLNRYGAGSFETVAGTGEGVTEALKEVTRLTLVQAREELSPSIDPPSRPSNGSSPPARSSMAESLAAAAASAAPPVRSTTISTAGSTAEIAAAIRDSLTPSDTFRPPEGAGISYSSCWSNLALQIDVETIERSILDGDYSTAIIRSGQLLSMMAHVGGYTPDKEDLFVCVFHEVSASRYRRFRDTIRRALQGHDLVEIDGLFCLHLLTEIACNELPAPPSQSSHP